MSFRFVLKFNKPHDVIVEDKRIPVAAIYMRYGKDYKTTFIDAQSILNDLIEKERLEFRNLRASTILVERAIQVFLTKEEAESGFVIRDEKLYFVQGSKHSIINQLGHKKQVHQS